MALIKGKQIESLTADKVIESNNKQFISKEDKKKLNIISETSIHTHDNKNVIDNLTDSANMLMYKGKIVVNNNEYVFKTLPRKTAPSCKINCISNIGGTLPWQK